MNNPIPQDVPVTCRLKPDLDFLIYCDDVFTIYDNCLFKFEKDFIHVLASGYTILLKMIETQIFQAILVAAIENGCYNHDNKYYIVYQVDLSIETNQIEFYGLLDKIKSFLKSDDSYFEIFNKSIRSSNSNRPIIEESKWNDSDENRAQYIISLECELSKYRDLLFL